MFCYRVVAQLIFQMVTVFLVLVLGFCLLKPGALQKFLVFLFLFLLYSAAVLISKEINMVSFLDSRFISMKHASIKSLCDLLSPPDIVETSWQLQQLYCEEAQMDEK